MKFGGGRNGAEDDFFSGRRRIVPSNRNSNVSVYKELPRLHNGTVETPVFMHDNARCNKAKTVLNFLEEEGIAVMKWPPQCLDMNPQEKIIEEKSQKRNPQNIDVSWGFLKEEYISLTTTFCKKLIGSCGQRFKEVIQCKGKFRKY